MFRENVTNHKKFRSLMKVYIYIYISYEKYINKYNLLNVESYN